jgi:hypothetical protein
MTRGVTEAASDLQPDAAGLSAVPLPGKLGDSSPWSPPVLERFVARIPTLLLLGVVFLGGFAVVGERGQPADLLATAPAAVLAIAYLRAGRRSRRGGAA